MSTGRSRCIRRASTPSKAAIALIVVAVVAAGAFEAATLVTRSGSTTLTSSSAVLIQTGGLLGLFSTFPRMGVSLEVVNGEQGVTGQNLTYSVLGRTLANSTEYTVVKFTTSPLNRTTILWFDPQGNVAVADVVGDKNYTGSFAPFFSTALTTVFQYALFNATLLNGLQKTVGSATQNVGGTQMSVSTYNLETTTKSQFSTDTIEVGTIPGTTSGLIVYLSQVPTDPMGITVTFQVTSLSKA